MSKLLNLIAVLVIVTVVFVLGLVLYGSTKTVKFKKHTPKGKSTHLEVL